MMVNLCQSDPNKLGIEIAKIDEKLFGIQVFILIY